MSNASCLKGYSRYILQHFNATIFNYTRLIIKPERVKCNEFIQALTEKEKELTRESEERMRQEEKAKAAASEQQRLMQQMLAQQEGHQEMLCKVQADFAQQQNRLMQVKTHPNTLFITLKVHTMYFGLNKI